MPQGALFYWAKLFLYIRGALTQELIHYNFSAEWAIQSFMLALCILFTDGTYEAHLAYDIFPNGSQWGTFWNLQPLR